MDHRSVTHYLAVAALAVAIGGCSGAAVATPSPVPATTSPTAAATAAGPAAFADWTERQGFGGSSGLNNVNKLAKWLTEHRYDVTAFDLDNDGGDVVALVGWLDAHPATACWAEFHTAIRKALQAIADGYAQSKLDLARAGSVDVDVANAMYAESQRAFAMPAPANCP